MRNQGFVFLCFANVLLTAWAAEGAVWVWRMAPIMTLETPGTATNQITCTGRILDAQGQPISGARVILYQMTDDGSRYTQKAKPLGEKVTGADGAYAFAGPRESDTHRESYLLVKKEGLALGWAVWFMREDQQADVTLGEPKELTGEVVDENGKPLAGADVRVAAAIIGKEEDRRYFANFWIDSDLLAVKTDAGGRFVFPNLPAEATCELVARSPGRAVVCTVDPSSRGEAFQLAPGKAGIKVTLPPEAKVRGSVVEKAGGKAIRGIKILVQPDPRGIPLPQEPIVSAEDGSFSVGGLAPGRYTVELMPAGNQLAEWIAESTRVTVQAGETKSEVKLELAKGAVLEVLAKEGGTGKPVVRASVSVHPSQSDAWASSQTDPNGLARIRIAPGLCQVSGPYKQGYTIQRQPQPTQVEVQEGETKRIEYTLTATPRVAGVVRDESGKLLAGVELEIKPAGPEQRISDGDGKFEVSWDPSNWGPDTTTFVLVARHMAKNLAATADIDEQTKNLDLKLKPGVVFTGKVLNHEGKPLAGARMQIMLRAGRWGSTLGRGVQAQPRTVPDGTFAAKAIPPERTYTVTALAEGYGTFQVEADASNAKDNRMDLGEFKLPLADQSISGVVVDANDKPVADAYISAYGENQPDRYNLRTDSEGKFVVKGVCAGPMRISVNVRGSNRLYGYVQTQGGATDVKVVLSERSTGEPVVRKPQPLVGKALPDLQAAGVELPADAAGRMLLVCLWDVNQRPSRYCLTQLMRQAAQLGEKGVAVVALQASKIEPSVLSQWLEKNKAPFPVGCLAGDVEKARFAWGAVSLPHLILTDKKHIVVTEGFALGELDKKIEEAAGR